MTSPIHETLFNDLHTRFDQIKDAFTRLDSEADARITRWRYAEESAFELRAEFYRRFDAQPGTLVDDEPIHASMYWAYGYDGQERLLCAALFQAEELPRSYTFYEYAEGYVDCAEFVVQLYTNRYHLQQVGRLVQPVGQPPVHYAAWFQAEGQSRSWFEAYHYDDLNRLSRITGVNRVQAGPISPETQRRMEQVLHEQRRMAEIFLTPEQKEAFDATLPRFETARSLGIQPAEIYTEESFEYEAGKLKRIVARSGEMVDHAPRWSHEETVYEAPRAGETAERLYEAAYASLYQAIIHQLMQLDPVEREQTVFYNLQVSYDAVADDGLLLTLGLQAQRETWEKTTQERSYRSLHYSALQDRPKHIEIGNLPGDYARWLREHRRSQQWDTIRKLLKAVARALNDHDWTGIFKTTDDFIVFANDYEALEDVHDEIRACVPEAKLQLLRASGLLD